MRISDWSSDVCSSDLVITVTPGKQYALGDIAIRSPPVQPTGLIRDALPLKTGDPILAERVLAAEANISLILPQQGYPFVELGDRDIALDPATMTGDYTLPVEPGPRGSFGDIVTARSEAHTYALQSILRSSYAFF